MSTLPYLRLWLRSSREIPHQALVRRRPPKDGHGAWVIRKKWYVGRELKWFDMGNIWKCWKKYRFFGEFAWFFMFEWIFMGTHASSWDSKCVFYGKTCVERDSNQILQGQKMNKCCSLSIWMSNEKHGIKAIRAHRVLT